MGIRLEWVFPNEEALVFRTGATEQVGIVLHGPRRWIGVLGESRVCEHTTPELAAWGIVDELRRQEAKACKTSTR
jgi:hypothetical protein